MSGDPIILSVTASSPPPVPIPERGPKFRVEIRPYLPIDGLTRSFGELGAIPSLPCFMPGLEAVPALVFFTLQNVEAASDALRFAVAFQSWWMEIHQRGETPEGTITFRDGSEEYSIQLKGKDLDVNKLAAMFMKKVGTKKGK